jgi:YVTN family beta-propeller protein
MKSRMLLKNLAITIAAACFSCSTPSEPAPYPPSASSLSLEFSGSYSPFLVDIFGRDAGSAQKVYRDQARSQQLLLFSDSLQRGSDSLSFCQVTAIWTECTDDDFERYRLYRALEPGIRDDSTATVIFTGTSPDIISYVDDDVHWNTDYFYAVRTFDSDCLNAWSNEACISILEGVTSSYLQGSYTGDTTAGSYGKGLCEVTLNWTVCPDPGFASYTLFRSENPGIRQSTGSATSLVNYTSRYSINHVDHTNSWNTTYYYALRTYNNNANKTWSNEVCVTTPGGFPPEPSFITVTDITWSYVALAWTDYEDYDFLSYRLYRSITPFIQGDTTQAELLYSADSSWDTTYTDTAIEPLSDYFYSLLTSNTAGYGSWSNEVSAHTPISIPDSVVSTVDVGNDPWALASLPSAEYIYVTNRGDDNVSVIRTADNTVIDTVNVGDTPFGICSDPAGEFIYVANSGSDDVSVIRTSDNTVTASVTVGGGPVDICANPSGEYVYVTCLDENSVNVIRTADNTVVDSVSVGINPYCIRSLPSGEYLYVANWSSNTVSVIRTADNSVVDSISLFNQPIGISVNPSGKFLYVSTFGTDRVSVIDTQTNDIVDTINVGNGPWAVFSHPSGLCIYVANSLDNTIDLIRTSDNLVVLTLPVGINPSDICSPEWGAAYVVNYWDGNVSVVF